MWYFNCECHDAKGILFILITPTLKAKVLFHCPVWDPSKKMYDFYSESGSTPVPFEKQAIIDAATEVVNKHHKWLNRDEFIKQITEQWETIRKQKYTSFVDQYGSYGAFGTHTGYSVEELREAWNKMLADASENK